MRRSTLFTPLLLLFFVLPASTQYEMHDFGFGGGGGGISESTNYASHALLGEVSANNLSGSAYDLGPGLLFTRQSHTPAAPTFTNPANHYNRLQLILNTSNNPSDAVYAVAISQDSFVSTQYVQSDQTIGSQPFYQTYAGWGGASGIYVIGLDAGTTYQVKAKAVHTKYTESAYSAVATAATAAPTITYDLDVSATDSETAAPYTINFGTLSVGSITTASSRIWVDLSTNAESGAFVYMLANDTGLHSSAASYTITALSGDLSSVSEGYGLRIDTTTQSSGTLLGAAPYTGSNEVVGIIDGTSRTVFTTNNAPLENGRGSLLIKAKASSTTPAATDYSSIITMIASATF